MDHESKWLVGVDLGGTSIKIAFIRPDGELIKKWSIATDKTNNGANITNDITQSVEQNLSFVGKSKKDIAGIGMGAPAFIEMTSGYIYHAVNIGWKNYNLKTHMEAETGLPVIIDNDANVAAVGEMWKGAGEGAKDLLCVTLGTGVGGGIISNGDIIHGTNGMAGEIGHITVIPESGYPCNCGKSGCLETISSATGIVRMTKERLNDFPNSLLQNILNEEGHLTTKDVFDCVKQGDLLAKEVIDRVTFYLGLSIANLSNVINPSKIVIGGGVSTAGSLLLEPLQYYFKKFALKRVYEGANLVTAQLGNDAGVIGAAWLIKRGMKNK